MKENKLEAVQKRHYQLLTHRYVHSRFFAQLITCLFICWSACSLMQYVMSFYDLRMISLVRIESPYVTVNILSSELKSTNFSAIYLPNACLLCLFLRKSSMKLHGNSVSSSNVILVPIPLMHRKFSLRLSWKYRPTTMSNRTYPLASSFMRDRREEAKSENVFTLPI